MRQTAHETIVEIESFDDSQLATPEMAFEERKNSSVLQYLEVREAHRIEGVVTGVLVGFGTEGEPLVDFPDNSFDSPVGARAIIALVDGDLGKEVVLMFEHGDLARPLVMGVIQTPNKILPDVQSESLPRINVEIDGERLVLSAEKEIVLCCGEASITLTRSGKVLIRGAYVLSRSSGVNKIKGGSIQLN